VAAVKPKRPKVIVPTVAAVSPPIMLPWPLQDCLEAAVQALLQSGDQEHIDFSRPAGEAAIVPPESVSWRVFKNPVSLFIGGIAAVILELAEPRVRTGVWEHTSFRGNPVGRLRKTGLAALVTVYGPGTAAEAMIGRVRRMHDRIAGTTPAGQPYRANDPELLNWVESTAALGFLQACHTYVRPIPRPARDRYYAEGAVAGRLYGASGAPASEAEVEALLQSMRGRLERSDIVFEFLSIMHAAPVLPLLLKPVQHLLVRAAVELTPRWARTILAIDGHGLHAWEAELVRQLAGFADRFIVMSNPAVQACRRMGLPANYLYVDRPECVRERAGSIDRRAACPTA
jgi:uncharacterized protein (DUF2236 family)